MSKIDAKAYSLAYAATAKETMAVIEYAKSLPYVHPSRGLVMVSRSGGATAITLAAKDSPGVLTALNFAGGGGGRPDTHPHPSRSSITLLQSRDMALPFGAQPRRRQSNAFSTR